MTGDIECVSFCGANRIVEIARPRDSLATHNGQHDRYEIHHVMGPDEYHDEYPRADPRRLSNNAYTNLMATRVRVSALEALKFLPENHARKLRTDPYIRDKALEELDRGCLRRTRGDTRRLDCILEASGDSFKCYRQSKQAGVLTRFYRVCAEERGG